MRGLSWTCETPHVLSQAQSQGPTDGERLQVRALPMGEHDFAHESATTLLNQLRVSKRGNKGENNESTRLALITLMHTSR